MALRTGLWPRVLWLSLFGVLVPQVVGTTEAQVFSPSPQPSAAFPKGPPVAAPLSLTASDGSGLQLVSMTASHASARGVSASRCRQERPSVASP
jgi:hypothetical protein